MTNAPLEPGAWTIDAAHTRRRVLRQAMTVARVTGRFAAVSGEAKVPDGDPLSATVTRSIDVASVSSGHHKRDELIRSADFLDAELPGHHVHLRARRTGADGPLAHPRRADHQGRQAEPVTVGCGGRRRHSQPPRRHQGGILRDDRDGPERLRALRLVRNFTPAARSCPTRSRSASRLSPPPCSASSPPRSRPAPTAGGHSTTGAGATSNNSAELGAPRRFRERGKARTCTRRWSGTAGASRPPSTSAAWS